ncbi:MAG TPA: phosphomannose isomerase type II C-terminal cupin domain [Nitrososphaera sp.]|jgi:mannose-1-phosphate guanylyltransferase
MAKMATTTNREQRPWGWFEQFNENDPCTVKLIHVKAGSRLSLQYHEKRREFWKVVKGPAIVQIDGKTFTGKAGDEFEIPTRAKHRLAAKKSSDALVLEISYGHFDEDDIVRIEDDFGRTKDVLYA